MDETMNPVNLFESQAVIKVIGLGGAGGNALNRMVEQGIEGVDFIAMNTDVQALERSLATERIVLGGHLTRGLGTGGDPVKGEAAAKEVERRISELLDGADMVFLTAGMGGGTGTGSIAVVAEVAQRLGILTVAVVTKPFGFEGPRRRKLAEAGLAKLKDHVDTLIVIPNQKILEVVDKRTSYQEAFAAADDVLGQGVQGITDIIAKPGLINVDFADVRAVLKDAGEALMGMGQAVGDSRARIAVEQAANSPLLETSVAGAKKILVNITAGLDFSIGEARDAMEYVSLLSDAEDGEVFMGQVIDPAMGDRVMVTLIAAGMNGTVRRTPEKEVYAATPVERPSRPESRRQAPVEIEVEDLRLDVPTFLRRKQSQV
jgi:cell division protein FtsZ